MLGDVIHLVARSVCLLEQQSEATALNGVILVCAWFSAIYLYPEGGVIRLRSKSFVFYYTPLLHRTTTVVILLFVLLIVNMIYYYTVLVYCCCVLFLFYEIRACAPLMTRYVSSFPTFSLSAKITPPHLSYDRCYRARLYPDGARSAPCSVSNSTVTVF